MKRGEEVLETQAKDTSENRELFVEFCVENELVVTNTRFKKPNKEYCTYKEVNTNGFLRPMDPGKIPNARHVSRTKQMEKLDTQRQSSA